MKFAPRNLFVAVAWLLITTAALATERTGEQIYRELCISCHGMAGEGTKDQPKVLAGTV